MKKVTIYTDGSCLGNPGPGGWSAILILDGTSHRKEITGGYRRTTNNRMELTAAIQALLALKEPCVVALHSDSQYLCNAIQKGWLTRWEKQGWKKKDHSPIPNTDLWKQLCALLIKHDIEFIWLRGHSGHEENERCDSLARCMAQQADLPADDGYESCVGTARK